MAYTFKHGDRPLDGLTVQRAVGRGGFGEVYYALTDSGKQVALKYLRENPEIELRGIGHVMNLKSPYLITIYDVKRNAAGEPFVIMEYVGGPSLRELMLAAPGDGLGVQKAAFFLSGIAKGLSYLHERGIVHRDLKPANIFYDDGYVKIGDYGLSKHISVSRHSGQTVSVGTVHYMAPEIGSGNYTKAIDIYALGVILYEMLTGRLPFSGASTAEILMRHLRDNPDLTGIPQPFAAVIAKALAKDPNDRYQDVDEMLAAVMDADVSRSVEAFDHSALTQAPRTPEASDEATVTAPRRPGPVPTLDVRDMAPPDLRGAAGDLPARLQRKLDHLTRKLEQKAVKLERKYGAPRRPLPTLMAATTTPPMHRRTQLFLLLMVTAAIATALGLLTVSHGPGESRIAAVGLFLAGGTIGPLLAHLRFLQRSPTRSTLLDRLAYASMAGVFMLPAYGMATDEVGQGMGALIFAPLAAMLLCCWNGRIEAGRRGKVDGRAAIWPAIIGLVTAHILDAGEYGWTAAGICAAISLLTQAAASMWPAGKVAPGVPPAGDRLQTGPTLPVAAAPLPAEVGSQTPTGVTAEAPLPHGPPAPPEVVQANQPSFVGRTANAGMSFLGKILLLAGLALALGQGAAREYARQAVQGGILQVNADTQSVIDKGLPRGVVSLPLLVGSLLLVTARRRQGAMHFLRGCVGCAFVVFGALAAMLWASTSLELLFTTGDLNKLDQAHLWGPALLAGLPLAVGLVLLLWPHEQAQQTIVV